MKTIISTLMLGLASVSFSAQTWASPIIVNGIEWRQVTETVGFSYNQLDSIYDTSTGQLDTGTTSLTNSLGQEIDFAGWTWAGKSDFNNLTSQLGVAFTGVTDGINTGSEIDSDWGPAIVKNSVVGNNSGLFIATHETQFDSALRGMVRELSPSGFSALLPTFIVRVDPAGSDSLGVGNASLNGSSLTEGVFLFRELSGVNDNGSSVPTPTSFLLLLAGLLGMIRLRKQSRSPDAA